MTPPDLSRAAECASVAALRLVCDELTTVCETLGRCGAELDALADVLVSSERVFVLGLGRSGLAMRMTGMRLMHLGLVVHVVGDVTTPAIRDGDVLLVASGSGITGGIVRAVEQAQASGARIVVLTANDTSPIAQQANAALVIPAAGKLDRSGTSAQYAGSLFEQAVVLVGDALFHTLWRRSGAPADELWPRHANLE